VLYYIVNNIIVKKRDEFMEKIKEVLAKIRGFFAGIFSKISENPNAKRWIVEGCISVGVGILIGIVTFNLLKGDKSLNVSKDAAKTPVTDEETLKEGEGLPESDPDSDVVIEVVEGDPVQEITVDSFAPPVNSWSSEEIDAALSERNQYLGKSKFQDAVVAYWETRGITDISGNCMYLFHTDEKMYSPEDFQGLSPEVIHVAKNEIYARHGYSFKDPDLYNYFMAQIWYTPSVLPADFSEKTFNETEVKNLNVLNSIDTL